MIINEKIIRKKMVHYNEPGHAHELTFSCYHKRDYLLDEILCNLFLEELDRYREILSFLLWAYVLMPTHVHMLIFPYLPKYDMAEILQAVKGKASKRYRGFILNKKPDSFERFCVNSRGEKIFRVWQTGGGFDRNLWNSEAIHRSINYIEPIPYDQVWFNILRIGNGLQHMQEKR